MTEKENRLDQENNLRKGAEEIIREETARLPENREALSLEETAHVLHELRVHQIELEMQNEELRRTQAELNAAKVSYFDLYDLAPVGYVTVSKQGLILEANFTAAALLGTARNVLVKQPFSRFILKEDQDIYYLHRKQLFETGEPQTCELRMARRDETIFWARLEAAVSQDADGGPVSRVVLSDVTEHKAAEETLQKSEEKYRNIFNDAILGIYQTAPDGRILSANPALVKMYGYDTSEELTNTVTAAQMYVNPEDREIFKRILSKEGVVEKFETRFRTKGGEIIWVSINGHVVKDVQGNISSFEGTIEDITGRKRTEEALRESRQRLKLAFQGGRLGMWDWNPQTGKVVYNDLWAQMLEYRPDEVEPSVDFFKRHVHPDDLTVVLDRLTGHVEGRMPVYESEHRMRTKSGRELWVLDRGGVTERDKDGRPVRATGVITDITDRKQTEETLTFLAQSSGVKSGEEFFELLASYLAKSLGMDFVCIDYLEGDGLTARTVAVWCDGKFEDNVTYALKDTPCGEVVGKTVCCFPASVCKFFPRDEVLVELRAESYVGVTLWSHTGKPIGLIAVIGRRPLVNRELAETILKMVAVRAAGEMERLKAEVQINSLLSEKELLLREVHHRIKNNMNVITSLLSLQADKLHDPSAIAALEDSGNRVQSMMVLYDKLYRSADFREVSANEYLTSLIDEIVNNFPNRGLVTIEKQIDDFILDAKTLSPLGIILNELLTNIMKHAFIGRENGVIGVSLSIKETHATLIVQDNGVGIPESIDITASAGFGMQLVGILTEQLEGTMTIERDNGTKFILEFEI